LRSLGQAKSGLPLNLALYNEKVMNIPSRNRHWIKEIKKAYSSAE